MTALIGRLVPFLNKLIPSSLAIKGISKIDSGLGRFVQNALTVGYTADNVIDYLRNKVVPSGEDLERKRLLSRQQSGKARPDETTALLNQREPDSGKKALSVAAGIGAGLMGLKGGVPSEQEGEQSSPQSASPPPPVYDRTPLQSSGIQGVQKEEMRNKMARVSGSRFGDNAQPQETSADATGKPAMTSQLGEGMDPLDVLSDYSPQLARIIGMKIQHGSLPKDAAIVLKHNPGALKKIIDKIESDTHENFEDLIERIFGQREDQQAKVGNRKQLMQEAQRGQKKSDIMQLLGQGNQILDQLMRGKNG